jgi:transcriptional regulator with XRE-family HTH domain/quercetin dioxygenase-like cupin family protein
MPGLGGLVRERREAAGLSLRELARRLGVSASLLSRIENGVAQPSVTTLYGLTSELDLSLDLLTGSGAASSPPAGSTSAGPPPGGNVVLRRGDRLPLSMGAGVTMELLTDPADPSLELLSITYEAGSSSSEDGSLLTHAGRETGLVISGVLQVTLSDDTHRLEAGDSITFDSSTPHLFRNEGPEPVRAVWMNVGRGTGHAGRVSSGSRRTARRPGTG